MKRTNGFILTYIQDTPYLLPYGQNIAEHRRGMKINEAGEFLWHALKKDITHDELLSLFAAKYEATTDEIPELEKDMNAFLTHLSSWGMITENDYQINEETITDLCIADRLVRIQAPIDAISVAFHPFVVTDCPSSPDLTIQIHTATGPITSSMGGNLLICTDELIVSEQENKYCILFPQAPQIEEVQLQKDGKMACIHCHLPYREALREDLFHAIRLLFLSRAQQLGLFAIHSASIQYAGKAWLFSGSSGTGKSTHTNLWAQEFCTPILNGDVNLVSCFNGKPKIHGIPWCGTSGITDPNCYPLGGIVLLKQAPENHCTPLPLDEQVLRIVQRMISPAWTPDMLQTNLAFAQTLSEHIYITRLLCTKNPDAAHYMKSIMDQNIRRDL